MNIKKHKYYIIYKPFGILSRFSDEDGNKGLGSLDYNLPGDVYPVGRLDLDSEGLLLLTNDKKLNNALLNPANGHKKTYHAQLDGSISQEALSELRKGVEINLKGKIYKTLPAQADIIDIPDLPERIPPIRYRALLPTCWIKLTLREGKNRQVRKMTAKTGFPTLRLVRYSIENLTIENMLPADIKEIPAEKIYKLLNLKL